MSKIIRTRKPSVLPYYAAALAFVVLCAVLPVYRLWALLAALGAAVLAFAGAITVFYWLNLYFHTHKNCLLSHKHLKL